MSLLVVTGLRRSGTSMMMRMLEAGGMSCLYDSAIPPDQTNPNGYYEYTPVQNLDFSFISDPANSGKAVKLNHRISSLDPAADIQAIVMRRPLAEVVASFNALLTARALPAYDPAAYTVWCQQELNNVLAWVANKPHIEVAYSDVLTDTANQIQRVQTFLGVPLATAAMATIPSMALWRQRQG